MVESGMSAEGKIARLERALEVHSDDSLNFAAGVRDPACMADFIRNVKIIVRDITHAYISTHRRNDDACRACGLSADASIHQERH
jgi:hypothetical protein